MRSPSGSIKYSSGVPPSAPPPIGHPHTDIRPQGHNGAFALHTRPNTVVTQGPEDLLGIEPFEGETDVVDRTRRGCATATEHEKLPSPTDSEGGSGCLKDLHGQAEDIPIKLVRTLRVGYADREMVEVAQREQPGNW